MQDLTSGLAVVLIAALPITELRASIPLAIGVYKLAPAVALFWSLIGNLLAAGLVLLFLPAVVNFCRQYLPWSNGFWDWLFKRTRGKINKNYEKYGYLALVIFVAIPLPGTGAWTGALASFLLGWSKGKSWILIALGVIIAGLLVTAATLGLINSWKFLFVAN